MLTLGVPMAVLAVLTGTTAVSGQAVARGEVRLVVRPVLRLEAVPRQTQRASQGSMVESRSAVRVRVSANTPWRLVVRLRRKRRTSRPRPPGGRTAVPVRTGPTVR